ncbi:MAG: response regulator transcription factor, partial [Firmicutes bacterium]|nr:response regulator transcription factor [Bacillota bacterium]
MKILVVDDDRLVCASLKTIIESQGDIEVIGMGHNGQEAITLYKSLKPDVLLMDIRMEVMTGLEAAVVILAEEKEAKILFLTTFLDDEYIIKALKIGAKGYLIKQDFESIVPSLRAVQSGQSVFGQDIVTKIPGLMSNSEQKEQHHFDLSDKERELIDLVAQGLSN